MADSPAISVSLPEPIWQIGFISPAWVFVEPVHSAVQTSGALMFLVVWLYENTSLHAVSGIHIFLRLLRRRLRYSSEWPRVVQDATLMPSWDRISRAAWDAAASAATWGPAVGALAFQVGSADRNLAQWAMDRTPLYGSQRNADLASDSLGNVISAAYVGTAVATPSGENLGEWALSKARGFAVGYGAVEITSQLTGLLKDHTARTRPDGSDSQSFPSNHAMKAGVYGALASGNLEVMSLPEDMLLASRIFLGTLTFGVSWARLEAGSHYPSDVLAVVAMGHFIGTFINDAFLGIDKTSPIVPVIEPSRDGAFLGIMIQYR